MNWKKAKLLYDVLAVIGFVLMVAGVWLGRTWSVIVGVVFMAACAFVSLKWCRCPHCGAYLGRMSKVSNHCPECGGEL